MPSVRDFGAAPVDHGCFIFQLEILLQSVNSYIKDLLSQNCLLVCQRNTSIFSSISPFASLGTLNGEQWKAGRFLATERHEFLSQLPSEKCPIGIIIEIIMKKQGNIPFCLSFLFFPLCVHGACLHVVWCGCVCVSVWACMCVFVHVCVSVHVCVR